MGKSNPNIIFYYDEDFDDESRPKRKFKPAKKKPGIVFDDSNLQEYNRQKEKGKNRRANKHKDKEKYDKYDNDEWN